jgi:hypothetical protein
MFYSDFVRIIQLILEMLGVETVFMSPPFFSHILQLIYIMKCLLLWAEEGENEYNKFLPKILALHFRIKSWF